MGDGMCLSEGINRQTGVEGINGPTSGPCDTHQAWDFTQNMRLNNMISVALVWL